MDISKTLFKEYCKCDRFFSLSQIYKNKLNNNYDYDEIRSILSQMFNSDGDDLISIDDEKLEAMLSKFQKTEELALKEASYLFKKQFIYYSKTFDQKKYSFIDNYGNNIYTYLDGYYEDDNEIIIVEVKSTTDKKFLDLGPKVRGITDSIFEKKNNQILKLRTDLDDKKITHLNKLYDPMNNAGCYFHDLAITKYIIENSKSIEYSSKKKITYYLAVLNSNYVFDGKYTDNVPSYYVSKEDKELFTYIEANDILEGYNQIILQEHKDIINNINNNIINQIKYKKECLNCIYKSVCFPHLSDKYVITTLVSPKRIKDDTIFDLVNKGYKKLEDIPLELLENKNHILQRKALNDVEIINNDQIKEYLNNIKYPIYHLDFEAYSSPLPRFKGEVPYSQSVFQFSIHIEKSPGDCDRKKDNYYYLPCDFNDHRKELIEEMIRIIDLSNGGTVLVYNKSFECTRIKELITIFPEYKEKLEIILDHIYDLKDVIKGVKVESNNYYHRDLEGSYSIKKVLPIFSDLNYSQLAIHNGNDAVVAYSKFETLQKSDIEEIRNKLIEYCGLDTYSMVLILNGIRKKVKL